MDVQTFPKSITAPSRVVEVEPASSRPDASPPALDADALRNVQIMHLLERVARHCNDAGIPVMALKGAALNLTVYERPTERPMSDLDLLVRVDDLERVHALFEKLGFLRSPSQFREDFFPRFYYEIQYTAGSVSPVSIDLHVRPFRLVRHSRFVPDAAFWERSGPIPIGRTTVRIPGAEEMLIHLAAHSAIHGNTHAKWAEDIRRWTSQARVDWDRFLALADRWRLTHAVRRGLDAAGSPIPDDVADRLRRMHVGWRDRLALWHAPRDREHLTASALVVLLTTPGIRFKLAYLAQIMLPDGRYLDEWSLRHGCPAWLAPIARCVRPLRHVARWWPRRAPIEIRESPIHGVGVFATRDIPAGAIVARYRGRPVDRNGTYVATHVGARGDDGRHEITGPLRFLNHSCRPNTDLNDFRLVARRDIAADREITIDYGEGTCDCATRMIEPDEP
ncbi:MAG: SET domain-containing protein-lysine N-methyltransferase [Planctomycetes bacterium]|nr:SET domain-containing protein-lysine N-methyltransferase [Planctomycetota bacterium]